MKFSTKYGAWFSWGWLPPLFCTAAGFIWMLGAGAKATLGACAQIAPAGLVPGLDAAD